MAKRRLADWTQLFVGVGFALVGTVAACMLWGAEAGTPLRDTAILVVSAMAAASMAAIAGAYRDEVGARASFLAVHFAYVSENVANAARLQQNHLVNAHVTVDGHGWNLRIPLFRMQTDATRAYAGLSGTAREELVEAHARLMLLDQFNQLANHAASWSSAIFASPLPGTYQVEAAEAVCTSLENATAHLRTHYGQSAQPAPV